VKQGGLIDESSQSRRWDRGHHPGSFDRCISRDALFMLARTEGSAPRFRVGESREVLTLHRYSREPPVGVCRNADVSIAGRGAAWFVHQPFAGLAGVKPVPLRIYIVRARPEWFIWLHASHEFFFAPVSGAALRSDSPGTHPRAGRFPRGSMCPGDRWCPRRSWSCNRSNF